MILEELRRRRLARPVAQLACPGSLEFPVRWPMTQADELREWRPNPSSGEIERVYSQRLRCQCCAGYLEPGRWPEMNGGQQVAPLHVPPAAPPPEDWAKRVRLYFGLDRVW